MKGLARPATTGIFDFGGREALWAIIVAATGPVAALADFAASRQASRLPLRCWLPRGRKNYPPKSGIAHSPRPGKVLLHGSLRDQHEDVFQLGLFLLEARHGQIRLKQGR